MNQPHGNPYPSSGQQPQAPAYQPMPPQGSYQGPWPSQLPSGTFPGMPVVGLQRPVSLTVAFWLMVAYGVLPLLSIPFIIEWAEAYMRDSIAMAATNTPAERIDCCIEGMVIRSRVRVTTVPRSRS